jgi:hypothetical protein
MELSIVPHKGIGPIRLGMTRAESRAAIDVAPHTYRKVPGSRLVDAYHGSVLQVFFDPHDRVQFIEVSNDKRTRALYRGVDIFSLPAEEAVALVGEDGLYDPNDPELGYAFTFRSLELTLWRATLPDEADEDDDDLAGGRVFATVGIGASGYFSSYG